MTDWIKFTKFTKDELDGKTVEYESEKLATGFGTLSVRQNADGLLAFQIRIACEGEAQLPQPLPELLSFENLQRHPKPDRAQFLLARDAGALLIRM
jgi:hypothetical protein